jgi:hypothetical protein
MRGIVPALPATGVVPALPAMGVLPALPATGVLPALPATTVALDGSVVHAFVLSGAAGATVGGGRRG